jgi:disulfide bond formation protein DsbB
VEEGDPEWFREPTRREHWIAAGVFVVCGIFFILMFVVLFGWWMRWVILVLGVYSCIHGIGHARDAYRSSKAR